MKRRSGAAQYADGRAAASATDAATSAADAADEAIRAADAADVVSCGGNHESAKENEHRPKQVDATWSDAPSKNELQRRGEERTVKQSRQERGKEIFGSQ